MNIKSNPFVYPYVPFYNLRQKIKKATFVKKRIVKIDDLKELVNNIKIEHIALKGSNVYEKILNIFLNKEIVFGPESYILDQKELWLEKIKFFISKERPLIFTILGYPFKIPVPLKTNRNLPDLGEVLSLKRLYDIAILVKNIWYKGSIINIVTEGVFGRFNNISPEELSLYLKQLKNLIELFGWSNVLKITELGKMEDITGDFEKLFNEKINLFKKLYKKKDVNFMKKYLGAKSSILRIVNSKEFNLTFEELMDLYNESLDANHISKKIVRFRKNIEDKAHKMTIQYLAYLSLRDDLNFMEKYFPNALALSVSPKPGRLGIIPLNKKIIRLPYHGIPIYYKNKNFFDIVYLVDLLRKPVKITEVYWDDDLEKKPFYYEIL